jgi:PhoH-like ATPase
MLRRIESVKRTGVFAEMKCISIENPEHLYVMDHFVVTHNTKEEKLEPWIAPIKDNLRYLLFSGRKSKNAEQTLQGYFDDGVIEVEAITYLRGRSIADAFIIIDEAQNLTAHELKTIITRVGENTKIVLTGDIEQIDNIYIDSLNNGLTIAVEKFRKYPIAGHVTLIKGERSALASLAARIL